MIDSKVVRFVTRLNHGLTDVTVDGVLEGALEVCIEMGDHLFLDVGPVDR